MVSDTVSMDRTCLLMLLKNWCKRSKVEVKEVCVERSERRLFGLALVVIVLLVPAVPGFTQVPAAQSRVPQQVVINGQTVTAVYVVASSGGFQAYTCLNPQQYGTADGSSQGWACYEQSTGVWLLNALPPAQAPQPQAQPQIQTPQPQVQLPPAPAPLPQPQAQPPVVIYPQQPPAVIYPQPPAIIYGAPVYPPSTVVVAPAYPPSVIFGTAAINAASRIISSALIGYRYPRGYYAPFRSYPVRGWRR
jgi:hypothetical protein